MEYQSVVGNINTQYANSVHVDFPSQVKAQHTKFVLKNPVALMVRMGMVHYISIRAPPETSNRGPESIRGGYQQNGTFTGMDHQRTVKLTAMTSRILAAILLCLMFVMPSSGAEAQKAISSSELVEEIARIEGSIGRLRVLVEQTQGTAADDSEALVFRLD